MEKQTLFLVAKKQGCLERDTPIQINQLTKTTAILSQFCLLMQLFPYLWI